MSSLRLKLLLRRLSVSAPRMKIKSQMPWPMRILSWALVLGLGGALALWIYDLGRSLTGFNPAATQGQLAAYKLQIEQLQRERDEYSSTVNGADSQLNIERAAQKQLVSQVKALEAENIKLKEDLAFFESLLPADTGPLGISIRRLKAEVVGPSQLRYHLLVMQGGKGDREFAGNVQLIVGVLQGGKSAMIIYPDPHGGDSDKFKLGFKHYQRMEGTLTLPDDAVIKSVQARVLSNGQVRAQQSVNL